MNYAQLLVSRNCLIKLGSEGQSLVYDKAFAARQPHQKILAYLLSIQRGRMTIPIDRLYTLKTLRKYTKTDVDNAVAELIDDACVYIVEDESGVRYSQTA